ncbi:sirohydrochlorin chelatase [Williamsia deligens]|uniref:Sirohydrochlorin chelatase n=1 Tax=Williamsia deligens TaxID=321325 RepID=A0ABW3GA39_9NOCA|nr:CbiX/SirB N-terminal domain-containing protein [Williamsia deligens]MCP2195710.1 Sirohydrochlorin ferrochelatase [Williamsia deligens]
MIPAAGTPPHADPGGVTVVLVAHGSRDPRFAVTARRLRDSVRVALAASAPGPSSPGPSTVVELAYLDFGTPTVAEMLGGLDGEVVVVPLLLGDAFHNRVDLPGIIADTARPGLRVHHTPVLADPSLTDALVDRLDEVGTRPGDGVLMAAVGASDPDADARTADRAADLEDRLRRRGHPVPVTVGFATRTASVEAAADDLLVRGCRRLVVAPWFLAAGTLTDRLERTLDSRDPPVVWVTAGPLGAHAAVVDVVVARVRDALDVHLTRSSGNSPGSLS